MVFENVSLPVPNGEGRSALPVPITTVSDRADEVKDVSF